MLVGVREGVREGRHRSLRAPIAHGGHSHGGRYRLGTELSLQGALALGLLTTSTAMPSARR
jgi:hypothetical protein